MFQPQTGRGGDLAETVEYLATRVSKMFHPQTGRGGDLAVEKSFLPDFVVSFNPKRAEEAI